MDHSDSLGALGWDDTLASAFAPHAAEGLVAARVIAEHRDRLVVATEQGTRDAVLAGRLRYDVADGALLPAVGDWVAIAIAGDGAVVVRAVLPRRSAFVRKRAGETTDAQVLAANVDIALVATSLGGDFNARRLERYLTLAWESGATPLVLLTKADLCETLDAAIAEARAIALGVEVFALSVVDGRGLDALAAALPPAQTAVLLGSSGVGKSTLINRLVGAPLLATGEVRDDGRGRHTTTHRQLVRLDGGALLIDTPGMRELQLWATDDGLDAAFAEITSLAESCRFRDCVHRTEPGCAVLAAVESGALSAERLDSWYRLARELAWLERKQDQRLAAEENARVRALIKAGEKRIREKWGP